jgi:hypothetical protein
MVGYAGSRERSRPWLSGVRERVAICLLAMLLAVMDLSWLPPLPVSGGPATTSTTVRISGTWFDMECSGRGSSTVVIYGRQSITVVINDDVKSELARVVRLCVLTVSEGAVRMEIPPLDQVLPDVLAGSREPAPFVVVSHESFSPAFDPARAMPRDLIAGYVLIHPSPVEPSGLVVSENGTNWPLPLGDTRALVLAILQLFWPQAG